MRLLFTITGQYDFSPVVRKEPAPNPSLTCARVGDTVLLLQRGVSYYHFEISTNRQYT